MLRVRLEFNALALRKSETSGDKNRQYIFPAGITIAIYEIMGTKPTPAFVTTTSSAK